MHDFQSTQRTALAIDYTLYGHNAGHPNSLWSELGGRVRDCLGDSSYKFSKPSRGGMGGPGAAARRNARNSQFMVAHFARFPCAPDFYLLIADALALRDIDTIDDQRLVDAGVAAEYFLTIRKQYQKASLCIQPVLPPTPVHVAPFPAETNMHSGLSSLPLARQNHVILHMMFSLMTPELLVRYQLY